MYCVIWEDRISTVVHGAFDSLEEAEEYMTAWAGEILDMTEEEIWNEYSGSRIIEDGNCFAIADYVNKTSRGD